jgi:formate hydrogenlyase transcriptional activator
MFFVARFAKTFGRKVEAVSHESMERLTRYAWPGNVREFQNIIERAVVLSEGPTLDLGPHLLSASVAGAPPPAVPPSGLDTLLEEVERNHILAALEQAGGVVEGPRGAAQLLRLHPNTLRSRMEKLKIRRAGHEVS